MRERLLTLDQVARYLGVDTGDVLRWIDSAELPVLLIDGERWFSTNEIDAWIHCKLEIALARDARRHFQC